MKQKQRTDSLVQRRAFLDAHAASGLPSYARACERLDYAVQWMRTYAGAQVSGRELSHR